MTNNANYKAIALYSGGLDSILSVLWMKRLGYEVVPIFFESYFFTAESARWYARKAGFEIEVVSIGEELLEVIRKPRYGFGGNLNPCIDCHALMFKKAGELRETYSADFLISGEVLAQRPMSQRFDAMNAVSKHSGYRDYIIRPLCQKLLPDTLPIKEGWVSKDELLDIQGRGRQRQMALAEELGLEDYKNPGGGCALTDKGYSIRLKDLMDNDMLSREYIAFLPYGRHFRLNDNVKIIVGKNAKDNAELYRIREDELAVRAVNSLGPVGVVNSKKTVTKEDIELAAQIVLSFTNRADEVDVVEYGEGSEFISKITVAKIPKEKLNNLWLKTNKNPVKN
jgi:tRNA-uridine 2-sulfurtransferase